MTQTNGKGSRNPTQLQESHHSDKHQDCLPCKILGTILEIDEGRSSANRPKNKKAYKDA